LSTILPSNGLPSQLKRGPTPASPSFKPIRVTVPIVRATAGANADTAYASYDDNELTDWVNDGQLSTAWIEYELEREAVVSEVSLKLNNFRSRTYPLRITVDGKEAFADTTVRSLGYFTAICKPQKGKKVRIQLATVSKDQGGNTMVEVSGKKLDDGVARDDKNAKGTFSIIEVEVYEKPKN
jgi:beta-galactosidase